MTELEGTIMEVQDIFIEMAGLINQQGEDITRIDENVESAESSVVRCCRGSSHESQSSQCV